MVVYPFFTTTTSPTPYFLVPVRLKLSLTSHFLYSVQTVELRGVGLFSSARFVFFAAVGHGVAPGNCGSNRDPVPKSKNLLMGWRHHEFRAPRVVHCDLRALRFPIRDMGCTCSRSSSVPVRYSSVARWCGFVTIMLLLIAACLGMRMVVGCPFSDDGQTGGKIRHQSSSNARERAGDPCVMVLAHSEGGDNGFFKQATWGLLGALSTVLLRCSRRIG